MRVASILIAACLFMALPAAADPITDAANKLLEFLYPKPKPPPVMAPPPEQLAPIVRPPPKAKPKPKPKPKAKQPPPPLRPPTANECALARASIALIGREATIRAGMAHQTGFTRAQVLWGLRQCRL